MSEPIEQSLATLAQASPQSITCNESWFNLRLVDNDNIKFHLQETPVQIAWLAEHIAQAEFWQVEYKRLAEMREAQVFMLYKSQPYKRYLAKNQGIVQVDASDEVCKMASKADMLVIRYQQLENQWRAIKEQCKGYMKAMDCKVTFLAAVSGLRREELSAQSVSNRSK